MRAWVVALVTLVSVASAQQLPLGVGLKFGQQPNPNPLTFPRVQSTSGTFTFLGSFKAPTNIQYGAGAMSVSGSTLYLSANFYDSADTNNLVVAGGIAAISIPTLSGVPALDGTNSGTPCNSMPCGTGSGALFTANRGAGSFVAAANYTASTTPSGTSVLMNSVPGGIAPNAGWYAKFTCTSSPDKLITAVSGNTLTWSGALPSGCSTTVSIHQFNPSYPWGNASGDRVTGSLVYNGSLYITGGAYYDATCNVNKGWILTADPASAGSWSAVNTVSGYPAGLTGTAALISRRYAGQLGIVPQVWQSLLGGPMFVAAGQGALSNVGCNIPIGFSFTTFNPTAVTGGAAVPVSPIIDYIYQGGTGDAFTASWPEQLTGRQFTGPFPKSATQGYPSTLATAPVAGATTSAFASGMVAPGNVVATASITSGSNNLVITSITSGTIQNNGIWYKASGTGLPASSEYIFPSYDMGPGNATGTGTYQLHTPATSTTTTTVTLTPQGYAAGYYQITFSDGESRIVHLQDGQTAIPYQFPGTNDLGSFATLNSDGTISGSQALTCSPSCTSSVQVQPMGDNLTSVYEGPFGTAFIAPGSRSLLDISLHEFGPAGARNDACTPGSSGTNEIPMTPDTNYYIQMQVSAFDLRDVLSASHVYSPTPYATWAFPGESSFHTASPPNCLMAVSSGWAAYDPTTSILYAIFKDGRWANSPGSGHILVYEWQVNSL